MSNQTPPSHDRRLEPVREVYEEFGREDPMYAALSRKGYTGDRWDPEEFFQTGRDEIRNVMEHIGSLGLDLDRGRALDFGCAIGRLTQALADHFHTVIGVDIASSMVERARTYNRHGDRVRYIVNVAPNLQILESDSFDLVYSNKVLQHLPPENPVAYVKEFVRVLRPGGLAVFQFRNGPRIRPGGPRAWLYTLNRRYIRRLFQRIRGRKAYEIHYLAQSRVQEAVDEAGGTVVDVTDLSRGKPGKSLRYCATK